MHPKYFRLLLIAVCIAGLQGSVLAQPKNEEETIQRALHHKEDSTAIRALIEAAAGFFKVNDYAFTEKALSAASPRISGRIPPALLANYYWQQAELSYKKRSYYVFESQADSVLYFADKAGSNPWRVKGLHQKAFASIHLGRLDEATKLINEATAISVAEKDVYYEAKGYQAIGNISIQSRRVKEAIVQYKRAIQLYAKNKNDIEAAMCACSMSRAFIADKIVDSAFYWNDSAKATAAAHPDNLELNYVVWQNEGDYHSRMGDFAKADIAFEKAKAIAEKMPNKYSLGGLLQVISYAAFNAGNTSKALPLAMQSKAIFEEMGDFPMLKKTYQLLYTYYEALGDYKNAYESLDEYTNISDSIFSKESLEQVNSLNIKYETTKKEKQIAEQELLLAQKNARLRTLILSLAGAGLVIGLLVVLYMQRKKIYQQSLVTLKKEQDISLLKALMTGEEKERTRLARELHDGLGGLLAASQIQLSNIHAVDSEDNLLRKQKAAELIQQAASESRRIAHNLLPETLLRYGLDAALKEFCESISQSKLLDVIYESVGADVQLEPAAELSVFRIVQELINNIIKHAGATEALVQLHKHANTLTLTIEDNGKGFSPQEGSKTGIGLANIQSRISYLNGSLDIQSSAQKGTSVFIEIQLQKNDANE